jgi:hypothetical protein
MNFKTFLPNIIKNNKESMRSCAVHYCAARKRGDVGRMITWLILSETFRDLNKGYLEVA